jgi:hypothetical protein
MTPNDIKMIEEMNELAQAEDTPLLDRITAYTDIMELYLDYNDVKNVRQVLRIMQRLVWCEQELS